MKRLTANPRLALDRLAEHGGVHIDKVVGGYLMFRGGSRFGGAYAPPLSVKRSLARLVITSQFRLASGGWGMTRSEVREVIRLTRVTSRGTVAHEEEAIREVLSV